MTRIGVPSPNPAITGPILVYLPIIDIYLYIDIDISIHEGRSQ